MVVAVVPDIRIHRRVPVHLLLPLFRNQAADRGHGLYVPVLWLHTDHGLFVLLADGRHRLLRLLLVRTKDLQCGQGGLRGVCARV